MERVSLFLFLILLPLSGCSGLDYSHLSPDAADFRPKRIAVFPEAVGRHESARAVINTSIKKILSEKGWYEEIINTHEIKNKSRQSLDLAKQLKAYVNQVNIQGQMDPEVSKQLAGVLQADAFFLSNVTSWGYGRLEGNKISRVALAVKLIDANKGTVIWKANHELIEDYWVIKPKLDELADELLNKMIAEMPH